MKKNEKGFTLVELLAVIVILGLLMAIAIPSVTKYITQSRVKTLVSTMDSYVTAIVTQVNDGEYKFSDSTKVFAIPIECVALEKGGTDPFGNWMQANEAYWAYVLVHYDSDNYTYEYGFTFKDDAGYGLYPTLNAKITSSMVRTGYDDLNKPTSGLAINYVEASKWEGFNITSTTELVVLEAESEGVIGDGKTTCTLYQKSDNYEIIEEEKNSDYPAEVISGTGTTIGDIIKIDNQRFYVIDSDDSTITMLAEHKINPNLNNPIQNETATGTFFSTTNYWVASIESSSENYPAYVYGYNSNYYQYIEAYELYLKEKGATSVVASMISHVQLIILGCDDIKLNLTDSCNNFEYKSWLITGYDWRSGSAFYPYGMYSIYANGEFVDDVYQAESGIRPIITISKSQVNLIK